jgi:hypothetical protein
MMYARLARVYIVGLRLAKRRDGEQWRRPTGTSAHTSPNVNAAANWALHVTTPTVARCEPRNTSNIRSRRLE